VAITVSQVGLIANSITSTTTLDITDVSAAVGDWLVVAIGADNAEGSGGPSIASVTDGVNTYELRAITNYDPAAASAGATVAFYTANVTSALTNSAVTVNFSPATQNKTAHIYKVVESDPNRILRAVAGAAGSSGSASTMSVTTGSVTSGNTVFAATAAETDDGLTGDSDTTNGSWSSAIYGIGQGANDNASLALLSQYKIVNATGTQTFNTSVVGGSGRDFATNFLIIESTFRPQFLTAPFTDDSTDTFYASNLDLFLRASLYDDGDDTFYQPDIDQTLTAGLFDDSDTFYQFVTKLFAEGPFLDDSEDTFYQSQLKTELGPPFLRDLDIFFNPQVNLVLPADKYDNDQEFYDFSLNFFLETTEIVVSEDEIFDFIVDSPLSPQLLISENEFYEHLVDMSITVDEIYEDIGETYLANVEQIIRFDIFEEFTLIYIDPRLDSIFYAEELDDSTDEFYEHSVLPVISMEELDDSANEFYDFQIDQNITSELYDDPDLYPEAILSLNIDVSFLDDSENTFYVPRVGLGLTADVFVEDEEFYTATITLFCTAPFISDPADVFYRPKVNYGLVPALYDDLDTFFVASVNPVLRAELYDETIDTFFVPQINLQLNANIYVEPRDIFFSTDGILKTLTAELFEDSDTFYEPQTNIRLHAGVLNDSTDTFYATEQLNFGLRSALYDDADTFYSPRFGLNVLAPHLDNSDNTFQAHTVIPGVRRTVASRYDDLPDEFYEFTHVMAERTRRTFIT
jgi:hypothetical protein